MALKTKKKLNEKQALDLYYKLQKTIRNPAYLKDYGDFQKKNELITRKVMDRMRQLNFKGFTNDAKYLNLNQELDKLVSELKHKYNIPILFDPAFKDEKTLPILPLGFGSISSLNNENLKTNASKRYISYSIDTYEDIEILKYDLIEQMDNLKYVRRAFGIKIPKKPHLNKIKRYFAVWDLVQQRQKLWPFKRIAEKLKNDGWYKGESLGEAEVLARRDYITACNLINIPTKTNKLTLKKTVEPIIRLKEGKKCKREFKKWEEILKKEGLGLDETLRKHRSYEEGDKIIYNLTDGATKQKLKKEIKEQLRTRKKNIIEG